MAAMDDDGIKLIRQIKKNNVRAFKYLFETHYEKLFHFALTYVNHKEIAEEIVQDVFITIWNKRKELDITSSVKAYLFTSVKNRSISYLRQHLKLADITDNEHNIVSLYQSADYKIEGDELELYVQKAIDLLPDKCKIIFSLSRNSGLTYKEIAKELGISTETVKTQIGIALKKIKLYLEIYWDSVPY